MHMLRRTYNSSHIEDGRYIFHKRSSSSYLINIFNISKHGVGIPILEASIVRNFWIPAVYYFASFIGECIIQDHLTLDVNFCATAIESLIHVWIHYDILISTWLLQNNSPKVSFTLIISYDYRGILFFFCQSRFWAPN